MLQIPDKAQIVITQEDKQYKFRCRSFIGEGNSGGVWEVRDQLGYRRALKIFYKLPDNSQQQLLEKLAILQKINHQHIVAVEFFGLLPAPQGQPLVKDEVWQADSKQGDFPYFIMPCADHNLATYLDGCEQSVEKKIQLCLQLCLAIRKIHNYRVQNTSGQLERFFHGNLKPANLLLFVKGKRETLKIADLGMANSVGDSEYLAPEQSQHKTFDFGADLFAVGKLISELLPQPGEDIENLLMTMQEHDPALRKNVVGKLIVALWNLKKHNARQTMAGSLLNLAIHLYQNQAYDYALKDLDKVIEIDPQQAVAHLYRANALHQLGQGEQALASYDRAIELDEKSAAAYESRGEYYGEQQQYQQAVSDFQAAIALDPQAASAYGSLGLIYMEQANYSQAKQQFDQVIELQENFAPAYVDRGDALAAMQQYQQAICDYQKSLALGIEEQEEVQEKLANIKNS